MHLFHLIPGVFDPAASDLTADPEMRLASRAYTPVQPTRPQSVSEAQGELRVSPGAQREPEGARESVSTVRWSIVTDGCLGHRKNELVPALAPRSTESPLSRPHGTPPTVSSAADRLFY